MRLDVLSAVGSPERAEIFRELIVLVRRIEEIQREENEKNDKNEFTAIFLHVKVLTLSGKMTEIEAE